MLDGLPPSARILLVYNPTAGDGSFDLGACEAVLRDLGVAAQTLSKKSDDFADMLREHRPDAIIVAGGDGTVAKVLAQAPPGPRCSLMILPEGTANNFARCLGIEGDPEGLLRAYKGAATTTVRLGSAEVDGERHLLAESAGIGAITSSMEEVSGEGVDDKIAAGRSALAGVLARARPIEAEILVDGARLEGDFLLAEVMNLPCMGPRLHLAPEADPSDGLFDIVLARRDARDALLRWIEEEPDAPPPAGVIRASHVEVRPRGDVFRVGDRFHRDAARIEIRMTGDSVEVALPARKPRDHAP